MSNQTPLVVARNISKEFPAPGQALFGATAAPYKAVDSVSLEIRRGETLALVGESGCGKSTTGRMLMRMIEPTSGSLTFDNIDLMSLKKKELKKARQRLQLIFQDPYSAFNPRMTTESIIAEPMALAGISLHERKNRVRELLPMVGLSTKHAERYPHQFSGGQRQRIGIARALALRPDFIVCDEPVSALDVSVQAQVINLLTDLQESFGLTYLFISHDLRVVRHIADRVAVMYLGRIVEVADKRSLYENPQHPYTKTLLAAVPKLRPGRDRPVGISASPVDISTAVGVGKGCNFIARCPYAVDKCRNEAPALRAVAAGHQAACHIVSETAAV